MIFNNPAAIFDMDGVLVVNMNFHEQAFYEFGKRYGKDINRDFFLNHISGSTNDAIMPKIFGSISTQDIQNFSSEKEVIYRELYEPHIKLAKGLEPFLDLLKGLHIPMAIASNAPPENILFILDMLGLEKYFTTTLNAYSVKNPKPAPDMFLKAAELLGAAPEKCIVFEDAPGGIRAAYKAGMKAVCILTSHSKEEFEKADLFVNDFEDENLIAFTNSVFR